ncbi:MAG: hypothetical protein NWF07_06790, partial [Candidatus Bathyarchaeota archaeon]|nr:hypothetical protein [Candidatus Bathyarchaeota archaeon]
MEHRDRALIEKVLASKYAGELLAATRPPIEPEGWDTVQAAMDYPNVDVTIPHQIYDAMMASLPPILGQSFQKLPYPVFLSVVNFLKSRDVFGALVSLELVSCSILGSGMAPDLKTELVRCIKITTALIALNGAKDVGMAYMESRFEPEGFVEFSNMFSRFSSSPLVVKLVAVVLAFLPALAKAETTIFGKALLATALDWLLAWRETFGATPFGILADFCTFIMGRVELFSRTHNWGDLFGSSPQVEWLDEADRLSKELDLARSKPGEHVPKVVCTKAKAHVAKALRFKEPLIGARARTLASESDRLEKALLNERKPPLGIIMTGPPGIGKTSLVSLVAKIYKQSNGIDDDLNVVYSWSNDKYQSPNAVSCIINVNDAFQIKDEYSDTGLDTYQSLVDSFALQVSGAAVDEKNVILTPDIVFVSTNASEYQFSKSKGGANKLDRRYMIAEFSWSLKCSAIAEEEGIPCSEVFKRSKEKDLVFYRLGYMDNTDNKNKMDMSIKRELDPPCNTLRIEDVLIRIIEMEKNRPDVLAPSDILDFNNVCSHRYPCNSVCGCWKNGELVVKDDAVVVDHPRQDEGVALDRFETEGLDQFEPEGEIPVDMSYWIMAAASLFAMISILLTGKPPALTVQHRVMVPEKMAYILAAPAALAFLALAVRWFRSMSCEGLIHSTPSVP